MVLRVVLKMTSQWPQPAGAPAVGAHLGGDRIVDQIVEQGKKLSAGHFSTPNSVELFLSF